MSPTDTIEFGSFRLLADGRLIEGGRPVPLTRKEAAVLRLLVEAEGAIVSKEELVERVWEGVAVTENSLTRCIHTLRRQLEGDDEAQKLIETAYGRGYRIVPPVRRVASEIRLMVLPLRAEGGTGAATTALEEELTGGVIGELARLRGEGLSVIALHTTLSVDRTGAEPAAMVGYVLSGQLGPSPDTLAATVTLERTLDGATLMRQAFEAPDAPRLAAAIARAVVARLPLRPARAHPRLVAAAAAQPRVYEAFLEARSLFRSRTPERLQRAISLYRQAIDWEPRYAPAYVGLTDCLTTLATMSGISSDEAAERGGELLARAEEIDPHAPGLRVSQATVASVCDWDFERAERLFRQALSESPADTEGLVFYARHLRASGRPDRALDVFRTLLDLDPLQAVAQAAYAYDLAAAGEIDAALSAARRAVEIESSPVTLCYLACVVGQAGAADEALAAIRNASEATRGSAIFVATLAWACALSGRRDEARAIADGIERSGGFFAMSPMALMSAALGDPDDAVRWLERGLAGRCVWFPVIRVDRRLDPVRADPRVQALLERIRPRESAS